MDSLAMNEFRKNIIDIKLKLDIVEESARQAMDAIYKMEDKMMEEEESDYCRRYGFLAGVNP